MSSMFKKKGGLAFKPKVPSARPRQPAAPPAALQRAKACDSRVTTDTTHEERSLDSPAAQKLQEISDDAAGSEPPRSESSKAGQTFTPPASAPAPAQLPPSETPSTETQPKPAQEASVEKPAENTTGADESTEAFVVTEPPPTELTTREGETQPPAISTSIETNTQEHTNTVEESSSTDGLATAASQEANPLSDGTPASAPEATAPEATAPKIRRKRAAPARPTGSTKSNSDSAAVRPKKRQRRAPQKEGDETPPTTRRRARRETSTSESRSRRTRSVTPEDAESQVVDLQKLKMADLTRDLHIGKKFSRHDELRERERQARLKAKLQKDGEEVDEEKSGADGSTPGRSSEPGRAVASSPPDAPAAASGPQFRIVDGQIVVDQSSLVMDRHARAAATQGDMETIEENDFTRLITSSSFMTSSKLRGPNVWTPEETELFYRGLRMFGTEFEMISRMFPRKQRRHIKLKFNREERHNPKLIDAALIGEKTMKMDIDEYKALTSTEFESVEAIEAEHRRAEEAFEAERKRIADEQEEAMRKKREELFADDDGDDNEGDKGGAEKTKKKGKRKGKKVDPSIYGELVSVDPVE
ncbi:Transcription factor TFIIIB component B''-like protein [Hapsidospora chrysogenum ATCC 11550]|uniref:Transcription factor TFIIIB component B''-like protein n=1 Tax=Hapsidospora chrysogenum (strain ATCC 11550 / CBS 779.69 / DSM 880 / IAM 14645 / JCM 23072 / IMI 49137) TaxID=857340 RepID=A0A086TFD7_HAPC1|nr:Transcription factor TFIIIB component B''-like protein [Hapsidospora chrysogenum ATCC 11550]